MSDSASLEIKVLSTSVDEANRRLDSLEKKGKEATRATDGLTSSFKSMLGPILSVVSATAALNKLVEVTREFDRLNAGLITATGSSEKAAQAFEALQQFAAKTPYDLAQAVEGFTQLVNLGLTPSEKALISHGNTASAMGKDLSQMIGAVADASTGEFERLKEFGIKAKAEGDQVRITFQGVTTQIGNNAAEIEGYLMALGENQFAGAMENRMNSLDGAISNLGDSWDQLFLKTSQSGVGDVIEDAVRTATSAIEELTAMIASGEIEGYLDAIGGKFGGWSQDVQESIRILTRFYKDNLGQFEDEGSATVNFLIDSFKQFPENVRAFIQIAVVEVVSFFDRLIAQGQYAKDAIEAFFTGGTIEGAANKYAAAMNATNQAREDSIQSIMGEREASQKTFEQQMEAARKLREQYDKDQAAKDAQTGDRLAEFKVGGTGKPAETASDGKAAKKREDEFKRLQDSLRSEEEALQASYEKRKLIIEQNTSEGSGQRADLMSKLDTQYTEELEKLTEAKGREVEAIRTSLLTEEESIRESYDRRLKIVMDNTSAEGSIREELASKLQQERDSSLAALEESRQRERDSLYNGLLTEEEMLRQSYERRKEAILESEVVTAEERMDLMSRLEEQYSNEQAAAETKRIQTQLAGAGALFDGLAGLAKAYGGEQSKAYRTLFAVSKAFSVAQAAMSIATGLAKAQELGFPANLAEMARVAATGAGIVSQISGANFAGAYDKGGNIPAGKIGLVGEYGPELMEGPAKITGRAETARMLKGGQESAPAAPAPSNLRIINAFDTSVMSDYMGSDEGEEVIMNVIRKNPGTIRSMSGGG